MLTYDQASAGNYYLKDGTYLDGHLFIAWFDFDIASWFGLLQYVTIVINKFLLQCNTKYVHAYVHGHRHHAGSCFKAES